MKKIIATAILTLTSSSVFASTIKHTGVDMTRGLNIEIKADGSVRSVNSGISQVLLDGTSLLDSLCVNLFQGITVGTTYTAAAMDAASYDGDGSSAAWLLQMFLPAVNAASGWARQAQGAALQLAVWDTIHDGGDGFAAGRLRSTSNTNSSVLALADQWRLAAMDQNGYATVYAAAPGTRVFQQQLTACIDGSGGTGSCNSGGGEVPEPGTLAMIAIGGAALLFGSWRRS